MNNMLHISILSGAHNYFTGTSSGGIGQYMGTGVSTASAEGEPDAELEEFDDSGVVDSDSASVHWKKLRNRDCQFHFDRVGAITFSFSSESESSQISSLIGVRSSPKGSRPCLISSSVRRYSHPSILTHLTLFSEPS